MPRRGSVELLTGRKALLGEGRLVPGGGGDHPLSLCEQFGPGGDRGEEFVQGGDCAELDLVQVEAGLEHVVVTVHEAGKDSPPAKVHDAGAGRGHHGCGFGPPDPDDPPIFHGNGRDSPSVRDRVNQTAREEEVRGEFGDADHRAAIIPLSYSSAAIPSTSSRQPAS